MESKDDENKVGGEPQNGVSKSRFTGENSSKEFSPGNEYMPGEVVFTRYLYPKLYVKQSLMLALLEHQYDETLYWTYELYFSGFEDETYDYIFQLYEGIYKQNNPNLMKHLDAIRSNWYKNTLQYWLIGTIVGTLCYCNYRMDNFIQTYFKVNCSYIEQPAKKTFVIELCERDIYEYKINKYTNPPRHYLNLSCKYGVRSNVIRLFVGEIVDLKKKWYHNWLYYASFSPIWRERLEDFNTKINVEKKVVEFGTEEDEEKFFERWNLEPDEQSKEIQNIIIGDESIPQISLKDFCEKYGCPLMTRTVKIKNTFY